MFNIMIANPTVKVKLPLFNLQKNLCTYSISSSV